MDVINKHIPRSSICPQLWVLSETEGCPRGASPLKKLSSFHVASPLADISHLTFDRLHRRAFRARVYPQRVRAYFTHWVRRLFGASGCRLTASYTGERHDRLFKNAEVIWEVRV